MNIKTLLAALFLLAPITAPIQAGNTTDSYTDLCEQQLRDAILRDDTDAAAVLLGCGVKIQDAYAQDAISDRMCGTLQQYRVTLDPTPTGNTLLHLAISEGNKPAVTALINGGADCLTKNLDHKIPYELAQKYYQDAHKTLREACSGQVKAHDKYTLRLEINKIIRKATKEQEKKANSIPKKSSTTTPPLPRTPPKKKSPEDLRHFPHHQFHAFTSSPPPRYSSTERPRSYFLQGASRSPLSPALYTPSPLQTLQERHRLTLLRLA